MQCLAQRPDLFGAVISQVGVYDMLRYQLFTIGAPGMQTSCCLLMWRLQACKLLHWLAVRHESPAVAVHAWMTEYGDPNNETDFEYLIKYSPLHNVRVPAGSHQYPAVLLTTGDTYPWHIVMVLCSAPILCCCLMS